MTGGWELGGTGGILGGTGGHWGGNWGVTGSMVCQDTGFYWCAPGRVLVHTGVDGGGRTGPYWFVLVHSGPYWFVLVRVGVSSAICAGSY